MKNIRHIFLASLAAFCIWLPGIASAHQPRIVTETPVTIIDPEISKAYYSTLTGDPQIYFIHAAKAFDLYVNVLVPDIDNQKADVSAVIVKDGNQVAVLSGMGYEWSGFYEKFGHDYYLKGPEYKARAGAGEYQIAVWSSNNDSKYSLAIGEIEKFDLKEGIHALTTIPKLKRDFFEKLPVDFILSPFGYGEIIALYLLAIIAGLIYRAILKRYAKKSPHSAPRNINSTGRILRFLIGIGLLVLAITTTWNPLLIFFSGFSLFEAVMGWCALNAALGRNTCEA